MKKIITYVFIVFIANYLSITPSKTFAAHKRQHRKHKSNFSIKKILRFVILNLMKNQQKFTNYLSLFKEDLPPLRRQYQYNNFHFRTDPKQKCQTPFFTQT